MKVWVLDNKELHCSATNFCLNRTNSSLMLKQPRLPNSDRLPISVSWPDSESQLRNTLQNWFPQVPEMD